MASAAMHPQTTKSGGQEFEISSGAPIGSKTYVNFVS